MAPTSIRDGGPPAEEMPKPAPPDAGQPLPQKWGNELVQKENFALHAENFTLQRLLKRRELELESMQNSTSWRVTAPIRAVGNWLKQRHWFGWHGPDVHTKPTFEVERDEYQKWLHNYSSVNAAMRERLASMIDAFSSRPLISVIMPSYNIEPALMRQAIESVRRQIYPHWELCISDDASTLPGVRALIESAAGADARIRVTFRESNGHISENSNTALDLARGDYVALMDADDLIPEDALFWVAHEISLHPEVDLIFTDEDKITETGGRFDPFFKPAWNPALMLSQNAFCHLGVYRRSLVEKVGRFREGYDGAQDHDLVLRCAEASTPDRIRHIPRILYHWRARPHSTAAGLASKSYAANAGQIAIEDALRRRGIRGHIEPVALDFYQVIYDPPDPQPLVSLIVPTTFLNPVTRRCLWSILAKTRYANFELLLIATDSDSWAHRTANEELISNPHVRVISYSPSAFNRSKVSNLGAAEARGALLGFLNDDVEVIDEDWLDQLVARVTVGGAGAAGPMLYYPSELIQHAGVLLGVSGVADHAFRNLERGERGYFARAALEQDYNCLTAACLLVRRELFDAVGGFDEMMEGALNNVDLCLRIRRTGARMIWTPTAEMYHHESLTFGPIETSGKINSYERASEVMRNRWRAVLDNDPCYNPNLGVESTVRQFQLAVPPRTPFGSKGDWRDPHTTISRTSLIP